LTDRELLEHIAAQVGALTTQVDKVDDRLTNVEDTLTRVDDRLTRVESDLRFTKETVVKIEHDHGQKLNALFNGYRLTGEKLDRIEQEVTKHEEFISKRLK